MTWDIVNKIHSKLKKAEPILGPGLTYSKERVKLISPRINFLTLHCLFSKGKNNDWMNKDETAFTEKSIKTTQNLIDRHYREKTIGLKKNYFKVIYWEKGLSDNDLERMYQDRLREMDLQAGRKR